MTFLEELRRRLQNREDHYHAQIGTRKVHITPPMLKYTLSDPNMYEPDSNYIENYMQGSYVVETATGQIGAVENSEWDSYRILEEAIPSWLSLEDRNIRYQGYLFGDASILFLDKYSNVLGSYKSPEGETVKDVYLVTPKGTARLLVSKYKNADVKVNFKITFQDFSEFDITEYVTNETDLTVALLRDQTSGVYVEESLPVYMVLVAKDFVDGAFMQYGLKAKVGFNVYLRDDFNINKYELVLASRLNFGTYKSNKNITEIALMNNTLNELINSRGKNKYDIKVSEVTDPKKWNYERMTMLNRGNYELPLGDIVGRNHQYFQPFVYLASSEMTPGSAEHDMKTQSAGNFNQSSYFFKADAEVLLTLNMDFVIRRSWVAGVPTGYEGRVLIVKNGDVENPIDEKTFVYKGEEPGSDPSYIVQVYECVFDKKVVVLEDPLVKGDTLSLCVHNVDKSTGGATVHSFNEFSLAYNSKGMTIEDVDVISPEVYCQKLLDLVSEAPSRFNCVFHWRELDYKTMLCAAESIRDLNNANIQGSLEDVLDWMKVLGYEYSCEGYTLTFKPRDEYFDREITALTLKAKENAALELQASSDLACAIIEIGYEQQDYESVNGRFEVNGTFQYSTGYSNTAKSTPLKLISPYRADPIGIELLFWERKNSTKDTKSDNDIFFVAMVEEEDHYRVYNSIVAIPDEADGLTMFNAVFNPVFLVKRNESLIGINTDRVNFMSTTSNRKCKIESAGDLYQSIAITKQLFKPYTYNFVTGNHILLPIGEARSGLVKFWDDGKLKQGFIKRIFKDYSKESESTWILYAID